MHFIVFIQASRRAFFNGLLGRMAGKYPMTSGRILHLGSVPYAEALSLQKELAERRGRGEIPDTLLLLSHPPVYTLGLRGREEHLLASREFLSSLGAEIHRTDRGGDITFHGPGQMVGYAIMDIALRGLDLRGYVRSLLGAIMETLAAFGISSWERPGLPGVWTGGGKIAAVGVSVNATGITRHGFALNVSTDLDWFSHIIPCGLSGERVTSMSRELGRGVETGAVEDILSSAFCRAFGWEEAHGGLSAPQPCLVPGGSLP